MKGKCIAFPEPERVEIGEIVLPDPSPTQLLTRTRITGVSTGTETRVYRGAQYGVEFPLIPGYENLGEVIAAGAQTGFEVGSRVYVRKHEYDAGVYRMSWGSQVSHSLTSADAAIPIPENVPDEDAIYAKVSGISLHGVKRARVAAGEWVAVVGLGIIGHLVVQHCLAIGAKVVAIDLDEGRRRSAQDAGADAALPGGASDLVEQTQDLTGGGVAVAFDATGLARTLEPTSKLLRHRKWDEDVTRAPRLVLQGSVEEPVSFDYWSLFMPEADLITPRDCDTQDMVDSMALMSEGRIRPSLIPATVVPYSQASAYYPKLVKREVMRVLFRWNS